MDRDLLSINQDITAFGSTFGYLAPGQATRRAGSGQRDRLARPRRASAEAAPSLTLGEVREVLRITTYFKEVGHGAS